MTLNWTYIIYRLYIKCNIKGINARSPKSIIISGIMISIYCIIVVPYNVNTWSFIRLHWIYEFIGIILIYTFASTPQKILLCRTFNVYFKLKYNIKLSSNKWKKFITLSSKEFDKLSKFYHSFVQKNYIYYVVFLFDSSFITAFMIIWYLDNALDMVIPKILQLFLGTMVTFPNIGGFFVFSIIIPKYQDIYYIRQETKYIAVATIAFKTLLIFGALMFLDDGNSLTLWMQAITLPEYIGLSVYTLYYPLHKLKLPKWYWEVKSYILNKPKCVIDIENGKNITKNITMNDVWNDEDLLDTFALYCLKEFAVENILFLIEINEFNHVLYSMYYQNTNTHNTMVNKRFQPQKFIPQSAIVRNINTTDLNEYDTKLEAVAKLLIKYYLNDSKFNINVSYNTRIRLCELFGINRDNYSNIHGSRYEINWFINNLRQNDTVIIEELCFIFDDSFKEIHKLIGYTYQRFKQTKEYIRYIQIKGLYKK